jgi:hypothetical protein
MLASWASHTLLKFHAGAANTLRSDRLGIPVLGLRLVLGDPTLDRGGFLIRTCIRGRLQAPRVR